MFYLTWILSYILYPAWALPINTTWRFFVFSGLIIYFSIAGCLIGKFLDRCTVNKSFIRKPNDVLKYLKENLWFLIACLVAIILNVIFMISPIRNFGDEALHLQGGLWVYDYLGRQWHEFLKIFIYGLIIICFILVIKKNIASSFLNLKKIKGIPEKFIILGFICFLFLYFFIFRNINYESLLVRYPPVSKYLYLISYLIGGITHYGPRTVQLIFYLLTAVYIYRIINLYFDKNISLFGASIYLFSPLSFYFAHTAEIASGLAFFITVISFHFLRYLKVEDFRDLILTSFLIGIGFLYKRDVSLMFFVCTIYIILYGRIKRRERLKREIQILSLSLLSIIPWMIIDRFFTWRKYSIHWSHLFSVDTAFKYLLLLKIQLWEFLFLLFLFSLILHLITKRDNLNLFLGLLFISFYLFYTLDYTAKYEVHRFDLVFYPLISIILSQFMDTIGKRVRWRHFYILSFTFLIIYLLVLNLNGPLRNTRLFEVRTLKFPSKEAIKWIKNNINENEKILTLRILPAKFYIDKLNIKTDKVVVLWYVISEIDSIEGLKDFCVKNKITHIMFPYSFKRPYSNERLARYLKENKNEEFGEVAKFELDGNYIYIYKILVSNQKIKVF